MLKSNIKSKDARVIVCFYDNPPRYYDVKDFNYSESLLHLLRKTGELEWIPINTITHVTIKYDDLFKV